MTISQPSKLVYVVDVPEIKNFAAAFAYNFFTPDECTNDSGGVPAEALARPAALVDADFIQWSVTRVPREVRFTFSLPQMAEIGNVVTIQSQRSNTHKGSGAQYGSLIQDNIDKIVNEDFFASNGFVAVSFHDGQVDSKVHYLLSGVLETATLETPSPVSMPVFKSAQLVSSLLPKTVQPHFVFQGLAEPSLAFGAQFYVPQAMANVSSSPANRAPAPTVHPKMQSVVRYTSSYFDRLKKVKTNAQINTKLLQDLLNKTIRDPSSPNADEAANMHSYAKQAKQAINQKFSPAIAENDYRTFVPFISVKRQPASAQRTKYSAEVVGFIIDKFEVLPDGTTHARDPIVVESAFVSTTADFRVKFHSNYCYTIRTIALLTMPGIDAASGDVATVKVLVSSKPSNKVYVNTTKLDAPPPPGDVSFVLNRETNKLLVTWAFPVWSQQDVKQFQVFRRASVREPFQLQKVYNFNDSLVKFPDHENPDPRVVENLTAPCQFYVDDDFDTGTNTNKDKSFIYAVSCIDAHGLSSCLSAQYQVWYDPFKNKLQIAHLSHLGAPKSYPNLYLDGDIFTNTIKVGGPRSKSCKLYFNPEFYYLYDDHNRLSPVLATQQRGGSYKLQFINLDNGKSQDIDILINDQLKPKPPISRPIVHLGPRHPNTALQRTAGV